MTLTGKDFIKYFDDFTICFQYHKAATDPNSDYAILSYVNFYGWHGISCPGIIVTEKSLRIGDTTGGPKFKFAPDTFHCINGRWKGTSYAVTAQSFGERLTTGDFFYPIGPLTKRGTMVLGQKYTQYCATFQPQHSFVGRIQRIEMWDRSDLNLKSLITNLTSLATDVNHDGVVISWETLLTTTQLFGKVVKEN
eukprot:Seg1739.5 transcript_id=Seg1739.5/GoldUCD/mRNA.D3Y31 product="hypothetical protein" pseudo=true protein_id=Seg1739.5/GoldUCD/D3Y31